MWLRRLLAVVLVAVLCSLSASWSFAEENKLQVLKADTIRSILDHYTGKSVTIRLRAGEDLSGTVAAVGEHVVQLSELSGKEFFDAVISIEDISAVIVRTKGR